MLVPHIKLMKMATRRILQKCLMLSAIHGYKESNVSDTFEDSYLANKKARP